MDGEPMTFTSLALMVLLIIAFIMFACHCLGPSATTWMRSNKEEKIGLSKNKLFHANGYMIHSGSEFLLSNSGSFKRFDTIDKDDYRQSGQHPTQHATTPLWNLAEGEVDANIPPQPLRPAPAPGSQAPNSASHIKTVTFSFNKINEITTSSTSHNCRQLEQQPSVVRNGEGAVISCKRSSMKITISPLPKPIDAPPPPRLSASSSALCATAIPRPITKRQISLQNGVHLSGSEAVVKRTSNNSMDTAPATITSPMQIQESDASPISVRDGHGKTLKRRNSSTNPFLCESADILAEPNTALKNAAIMSLNTNTNTINNSDNGNNYRNTSTHTASTPKTPTNGVRTNGNANGGSNPFYDDLAGTLNNKDTRTTNDVNATVTRNRSFSEAETCNNSDVTTLSSSLRRLAQNTTNPFTGLSHKVQKGPHMLQKTISEDFLFRKLGVSPATTTGNTGVGGNTTWTFGRSLLRQDSIISLGRRNSSQCSLDSVGGSMEGINLERAISCDSMNSDSSGLIGELDQPYTQITGYLCIGLQYDKASITDEGMELTVLVLEAKGLTCPFKVESLDTFVRIYLVPDEAAAMQTKIFRDSVTPCYNEAFNFWLKKQQSRHSLWFHLYHNGEAHTLIGEAEMEIGEMPHPITTWIPISDSRKCNAQWGELMFSLSYLPTAERLTIVVVKARSLKLELRDNRVQSVFVKVYLMNNEKKVLKKRTSLKRSDRCPTFNESMIFSVPPQSLTTVQLRLTVFGVIDGDGGGDGGGVGGVVDLQTPQISPLGHVITGSSATGKGLRHWHQMLSSLRKPVAMWHVLRRATYQPIFTGGAEAVVAAMQSNALRAKRNSII